MYPSSLPYHVSNVFLRFASGIGLESSLLFSKEGANVILADINLAAAEAAVAIITERYPNTPCLAVKCDVGNENDLKKTVDAAVKEFGRLDIMVQ